MGHYASELGTHPLNENRDKPAEHTGNKYHRQIFSVDGDHKVGGIKVDVYSVLVAFNVTNPGIQHAVKKLLCGGLWGKNDTLQDYKEAIDAISRAIQIEEGK
jgi:hypothetical protein